MLLYSHVVTGRFSTAESQYPKRFSSCIFFFLILITDLGNFRSIMHYSNCLIILSQQLARLVPTPFNLLLFFFYSGFCAKCAMQLDICPLCRKPIRCVENDLINITSNRSRHDSDSHTIRSQLSHDHTSNLSVTSTAHTSSSSPSQPGSSKLDIDDNSVKWTKNLCTDLTALRTDYDI